MRRKIKARKELTPDGLYDSSKVTKCVNYIMERGKKNVARKIMYDALDAIKKQVKTEKPLEIFELALKNTAPQVEVRSRRVGGANYQVPVEVRPERRQALSMKWIIEAARGKKGKPMSEKLAEELMVAAKNEGTAIKKKLDTHRMAEANRAFAHFQW